MREIINHGSDDNLLLKNHLYDIGTNDGVAWCKVEYMGKKYLNGKPMLGFVTKERQQLTINPSFHTYTLESGKYDEMGGRIEE